MQVNSFNGYNKDQVLFMDGILQRACPKVGDAVNKIVKLKPEELEAIKKVITRNEQSECGTVEPRVLKKAVEAFDVFGGEGAKVIADKIEPHLNNGRYITAKTPDGKIGYIEAEHLDLVV